MIRRDHPDKVDDVPTGKADDKKKTDERKHKHKRTDEAGPSSYKKEK